MTNIKQILAAARALIADPEHWTQGFAAIQNTRRRMQTDRRYGVCVLCRWRRGAGV